VDNFRFSCPTELVFGENSVDNLKELVEGKYKKILIHYGGGSIKKSGLYDKVMDILKSVDCEVFELGGVEPNPKLSLVKEGIKTTKENDIDLILAVGGGSVIDSAKAIGIGHFYNGDVWDFFTGNAEVKNSLPLGVILTIPATGSEASMGSVITKEEGLYKRSVNNPMMRPIFAIMDPEITMTLNSRLTFTGIMDIISHIFERYFTKTENVELIDSLSEPTMRNIIKNSYKLKENLDDYNARAEIMLAGTLAHNGLLGMGRQDDWASHNIAHEMSALYGTTHGTTLGIIFPAWMKYVYKEEPNRFKRFATNVFGVSKKDKTGEEIIQEGIAAFESFLRDIGVSTSFTEEKLPIDKFEEMAKKATERGSLGSFKSLNEKDIIEIYKLAK
jgi:alcohol dehydrogenase